MKYQILVEKLSHNLYVASCPVLKSMSAEGASAAGALSALEKKFLCYLHDPDASLEIISCETTETGTVAGDIV